MPAVDAVAQTEQYVLKSSSARAANLPENLIVRVEFAKKTKANAQTLPKAAVLTDETEIVAAVIPTDDAE